MPENDHDAIRRIFVDYATYLDSGDFAGYASLFADDGVLVAQLGEAVGPAAIERILEDALGPYVRGDHPPSIHVMNNHRIDIDGDTATTEVVWFYLTVDPDTVPTILQAGRYVDQLVRRDGRWKIARHDISRLFGRSPMMPAPDTRLDELTRRVQRLEDRDAIWRLFMTYKQHLDQRDFAAYAVVVHRRRGVDRQPRQGGGSGTDRTPADRDARGVARRSGAHAPPRARSRDRGRRRHRDRPQQLGVRDAATSTTHRCC